MPAAIPNLWPETIGESTELTPLAILRQQGVYLGEKTNNLVVGRVYTSAMEDMKFRHFFELGAPAISFRMTILFVEQGITTYPVEIRGQSVISVKMTSRTPEEFLEHLREILTSEKVMEVVRTLVGQSRA